MKVIKELGTNLFWVENISREKIDDLGYGSNEHITAGNGEVRRIESVKILKQKIREKGSKWF